MLYNHLTKLLYYRQRRSLLFFCGNLDVQADAAIYNGLQQQGWQCAFVGAVPKDKVAAIKLVIVTEKFNNKAPMITPRRDHPPVLSCVPVRTTSTLATVTALIITIMWYATKCCHWLKVSFDFCFVFSRIFLQSCSTSTVTAQPLLQTYICVCFPANVLILMLLVAFRIAHRLFRRQSLCSWAIHLHQTMPNWKPI